MTWGPLTLRLYRRRGASKDERHLDREGHEDGDAAQQGGEDQPAGAHGTGIQGYRERSTRPRSSDQHDDTEALAGGHAPGGHGGHPSGRRLTSRETELEALLGQQRVLADQVALGTLTVHLTTDPAPAPDEDAAGFVDGLRRGWVVLVDGARIALAVTGFLLPLAVPAVPIALAVRWWLRRRRPIIAAEG
jgi:uncharacterized protein DUF4349